MGALIAVGISEGLAVQVGLVATEELQDRILEAFQVLGLSFFCVCLFLFFFFLLSSIDIINSSTRHIKSQIRKTSDSSSSPHCSGVHRGTV